MVRRAAHRRVNLTDELIAISRGRHTHSEPDLSRSPLQPEAGVHHRLLLGVADGLLFRPLGAAPQLVREALAREARRCAVPAEVLIPTRVEAVLEALQRVLLSQDPVIGHKSIGDR